MLINLGRNEYFPIIEQKKYLEAHPVFRGIDDTNIKKLNSDLFLHYQELCKVVHTKGEDFMGLAKNLEEIKPDFDLNKHIKLINESLRAIIYLLYKFHTDVSFTHVEKDIIAKSFPKKVRGTLFA
jgi:hypothetical protein